MSPRQTYSFLKAKHTRTKYDIRDKNLYLLYLKTVLIAAGPGEQYRMHVSTMFTAFPLVVYSEHFTDVHLKTAKMIAFDDTPYIQ